MEHLNQLTDDMLVALYSKGNDKASFIESFLRFNGKRDGSLRPF